LFVTFVNYFLLLKGGKVCCFNLFFDCSGREGAPLFVHKKFLLLLRGKGVEVNVFFPSFIEHVEGGGEGG
jgi:hypothetical protein